MVLKAQQWVNATYGSVAGYVPCDENGKTGWPTMYSLTMALQHECGITALSQNFGPATLAAYGAVYQDSTNANIQMIVCCGLYCKGYEGGDLDGGFSLGAQGGFNSMVLNMGLPLPPTPLTLAAVTPKIFKALLSMDAYVVVDGGSAAVRTCQQWLNGAYVDRTDYYIGPCDGNFSRDVQKALVSAIQYQLGMSDSQVTGAIGPLTRTGLQNNAQVQAGSQDSGSTGWVRLFQCAVAFNGYDAHWDGTGAFTAALAATVTAFQKFCMLAATGAGDYETWMSLLVSTGDPDRPGTAFDCMLPLNSGTIQTVKSAGYEIVGRYLTGGTNKVLTNSEIALINDSGLAFFPIYQESGNAVGDFSYAQGQTAGEAAYDAAQSFGLPYGVVIYFSVDFDAQDTDITNAIIPHFQGVADAFGLYGDQYAVGVYGCRNTCIRLAAEGLTTRSFVSGMSTGYSGNLGFPLPDNWAFDQIKNLTIGSGAGSVEIDNDIVSGRDPGIDNVTRPRDPNDAFYTLLAWVEARAGQWRDQGHTDRPAAGLVAQYFRSRKPTYDRIPIVSGEIFGPLDTDFIAFVNGYPDMPGDSPLRDPNRLWDTDIDHFGASFGGVLTHGLPGNPGTTNLADFGSWGGDLCSVLGQYAQSGLPAAQAFDYAAGLLLAKSDNTFFSLDDFIADADALVFGLDVRANGSVALSTLFQQYYASPSASYDRYAAFLDERFNLTANLDTDTMHAAARDMFNPTDSETKTLVNAFWQEQGFNGTYDTPADLPDQALDGVALAWIDQMTTVYTQWK